MAFRLKPTALLLDADNNAVQTGKTFTNLDATTPTARQSPLTVSTTELELKPPANAITLVLMPNTNTLRAGKQDPLDGTAGNGYEIILAGNYAAFDVGGGESVWVMRDSADVSLSFRFITI